MSKQKWISEDGPQEMWVFLDQGTNVVGYSETGPELKRPNERAVHFARAPQWQSISSAPKDGTAVLVMQNNWPGCKNGVAEECNGHNTYVAAWWADERGGAGAWICYMDAFRDPECPIQPTHWQPLPAPPEVEG